MTFFIVIAVKASNLTQVQIILNTLPNLNIFFLIENIQDLETLRKVSCMLERGFL
jgi:hypothetical protein